MRTFIIVLLAFLALLQYQYWLGSDGRTAVNQLRTDIATQQAANDQLARRNQKLQAEIRDLKEGLDAAEERARSQLGMVKENEVFYQVVEQGQ